MSKVKVATMTYFCTFGTVTPVLIVGFACFFFYSIDLKVKQLWCKFQAHCSTSRTRVKCENIFCVSLWQIMSHNDTPSCHNDTHSKSIENSEATMTQPRKNFHTKRFCTSGRNTPFVVSL